MALLLWFPLFVLLTLEGVHVTLCCHMGKCVASLAGDKKATKRLSGTQQHHSTSLPLPDLDYPLQGLSSTCSNLWQHTK